MDLVSWLAIAAGTVLLIVVAIIDRIERKRDPELHSRMPGAVVFAAAFIIGGLLR
jgi:uncharacterized BrkB/YihY/UPF0761 family membrane protein